MTSLMTSVLGSKMGENCSTLFFGRFTILTKVVKERWLNIKAVSVFAGIFNTYSPFSSEVVPVLKKVIATPSIGVL